MPSDWLPRPNHCRPLMQQSMSCTIRKRAPDPRVALLKRLHMHACDGFPLQHDKSACDDVFPTFFSLSGVSLRESPSEPAGCLPAACMRRRVGTAPSTSTLDATPATPTSLPSTSFEHAKPPSDSQKEATPLHSAKERANVYASTPVFRVDGSERVVDQRRIAVSDLRLNRFRSLPQRPAA